MRIERPLDRTHLVDRDGVEILADKRQLQQPDPVLGADRPSELECGSQDVPFGCVRALPLVSRGSVVEDARVEVPVAGVGEDRDSQPHWHTRAPAPTRAERTRRATDGNGSRTEIGGSCDYDDEGARRHARAG